MENVLSELRKFGYNITTVEGFGYVIASGYYVIFADTRAKRPNDKFDLATLISAHSVNYKKLHYVSIRSNEDTIRLKDNILRRKL